MIYRYKKAISGGQPVVSDRHAVASGLWPEVSSRWPDVTPAETSFRPCRDSVCHQHADPRLKLQAIFRGEAGCFNFGGTSYTSPKSRSGCNDWILGTRITRPSDNEAAPRGFPLDSERLDAQFQSCQMGRIDLIDKSLHD